MQAPGVRVALPGPPQMPAVPQRHCWQECLVKGMDEKQYTPKGLGFRNFKAHTVFGLSRTSIRQQHFGGLLIDLSMGSLQGECAA